MEVCTRRVLIVALSNGILLTIPGAHPSLVAQASRTVPECSDSASLVQAALSPDRTFRFDIEVVEAGRRLIRIAERATNRVVWAQPIGLVNYRWTPDDRWFVYAVSPIYDAPGLFGYDTQMATTWRLVAPRAVNAAYPEGADWFVICSVEPRAAGHYVVTYLRLPDVDKIDFAHFPFNAPRDSVRLP
jgi:hypothetical protein